jgi:Mg2+ and Co2+ transporter CorA
VTVGKKLKTTLSSLKSAQADLESFALETESQTAKQMFSQFADQTKSIVEGIEVRVREIEGQEPQYKAR